MDEQRTCVPKPTTQAQRFGGFAVTHITYSVISLFPMLGGFGWTLDSTLFPLVWLVPILAMLLYFPLGILTAWISGWTSPQTGREKRMAVLLPTLVAWFWVILVLISIAGQWETLFMGVLTVSFLFAVPSSLFTITLSAASPWWISGLIVPLGLSGLVAGFLPPFLFALGSFWQSGRKGKKVSSLD